LVLDPSNSKVPEPVHPEPTPGAVHMRMAHHPWGRLTRDRPRSEGWSSPEPVLTRQQASRFMACGEADEKDLPGCIEDGDPHGPFSVFRAIANLSTRETPGKFFKKTGNCLSNELLELVGGAFTGKEMGRLYGANIIEEWTDDVSERKGVAPGERAVEIYWNASTWNPYQVVLFKTELRGRPPKAE
jgi:hypothetical protein